MGKSKKGQKGKQNEDFSDNESITDSIAKDIEEPAIVKSREKKKKALSKTYDESDSESIADSVTKNSDEPTGGRKKERKKKGVKNFDGETDIVDKVASLSIEKNNDDEDNEINAKIAPQKNKKEKKRKAKGKDDSDEDIDILTALESKTKKKSQKSLNVLGIDNDDDNENSSSAPQKFSSKMKSVFAMLDVEESEFPSDDDNDSFNEISVEPIKIPKFEKKKNKKKDKEEEEIDQIILEMDLKPVKKNKKNKQLESDDLSIESKIEDCKIEEDKKGKKSKKSKKTFDLDMEKELEALENEIKEEKPKSKTKKKFECNLEEELLQKQEETVLSPEDIADSLEDPKKSKRKKNREVQENEPKDEESLLKTTAQKKKDKKEKEKIKKYEEKIKLMKEDRSDSYAIQSSAKTEVQPETFFENDSKESTPSIDTIEKDHQELDIDVEDNKKSDKKKVKKKGEKEEKIKKPGKKQLLLMQEALKKVQEEKERLRLEEEAKIKAAEEAERKRQEQLRIEKERKELKKQKEKERRERLKAEGRLLSKTQKLAKARAAATLAVLRQKGFNVPMIGEKRELEDDKRIQDKKKPKKKNDSSEENSLKEKTPEPVEKMEEEISPSIQEELAPIDESEKIDEADDVKDNWEEDSESEDDTEEKSEKSKNKKNVDLKSDEEEESDSKSNQTESKSESETESESESEEELSPRDIAMLRIEKRKEEAEKKRSLDILRSPVVCVLGHVDTGKTKILDKIRRSHVQDGEAGGITQQIGATMVPKDVIREQCKMVKDFQNVEIKYSGLLIIDTPGHESFSNLRSRGSSLCDIAILVVDIMHGLEAQTLESINLLKKRKTPFIVALNKIDRLFDWKKNSAQDVSETIKKQGRNTKFDFDKKSKDIILQFAEQGLNAALYYENPDPRSYISIVPTSAHSGDGMGNLMALIVQLSQNMLAKRLSFSEELQCTVLEVKAIHGLGTTIDVILINGYLKEGDCIIVAGVEGPIVTQIRGLLMPQPLKELRVKNPYEKFKEVAGAQGIKILAKDLEKALAGLQLLRANRQDEIEICKEEVANSLKETLSSIKLSEKGVYVQASTLGSLEALLEFLRTSKIPYSGIAIGPVHKKDVMKASVMLEHESQYAVILAFDVKTERDAEELADNLGVRIFSADIIYHLFNKFTDYQNELKLKKRDEFKHIAVFPCKLRILPQFIFNSRDPIIIGITVEAGVLKEGTPLCVANKEFLEIGTVSTIEANHKPQEMARQGQEVCIKIEPVSGEAPKMYGRHFDHTDLLVSKITRQSIDACKDYFREDLKKTDWQLMVELKKLFSIL